MINAESKQIRLADSGEILYQPDASNPLPGQPVARVRKGKDLFSPEVDILESLNLDEPHKNLILASLKAWLRGHVDSVLEPLKALENEEGITGSAQDIARRVYDALGIILRDDIRDLIEKLDQEGRQALRQRKVRLGPVLVFLPALNKPAAVRLRALLWSLWNDKALPADVPGNGTTSVSIAGKEVDPLYYRTIGYPVYGPRAVRVDMLDRVIGCIYDNAKSGQFQAKHEMAEWMGCSIPDLYAILEAMGHEKMAEVAPPASATESVVKSEEPVKEGNESAPEPAAELPVVPPPEENKTEENKIEEKADEVKTEEGKTEESKAVAVPVKPVLATFRLRRNRPVYKRPERRDSEGAERPRKPKSDQPQDKREYKKKPFGNKERRPERDPIVMSAAAPAPRPEDSPFAILQRLKTGDAGK